MRSGVLQVVSGIVMAAAVAVAIGCSQDTLNGGAQALNIDYTPSPSGSGRYDVGALSINKIQALPADPDQAALFGTDRLTFRFDPYSADLTLDAPALYASVALSAGTYNVTLIEFSPPQLVDENIAPPPYANCIDGREVVNATQVPGVPPTLVFNLRSPQDDLSGLTFTLNPGQTHLALTVDVPGLIAGYESSFTCELQPCPGCPVDPRSVLTAFSSPTFRAALLANVSIH